MGNDKWVWGDFEGQVSSQYLIILTELTICQPLHYTYIITYNPHSDPIIMARCKYKKITCPVSQIYGYIRIVNVCVYPILPSLEAVTVKRKERTSCAGVMLRPDVWLEFLVRIHASKEFICLKPFMVVNNLTKTYSAIYFIYEIHSLKLNFAL